MLPNLIVPILNRYDLLDRMIASIDYPVRDLLIIDNGGELTSISAGPWVENLHVLTMPSNLGVAGSWNLGIKSFPHDNRWTIASNDITFMPGQLEVISRAPKNELTLMGNFPYWQVFTIGEEVVEKVGLASERFYPAYFEDNDWYGRIKNAGFPIRYLEIHVKHDNSSTIRSDPRLQEANQRTFTKNQAFYEAKMREQDYTESPWSLATRRWNEWLPPR